VFINFAKTQRDVQTNDDDDDDEDKEHGDEKEEMKDELNRSYTSEELKYNTEITMINRRISKKKNSLRKTSNCSHISKIEVRRDLERSSSSDLKVNSGDSGCINHGFEIEPPLMYSNIESKIESVSNLDNTAESMDYEYYSKC
jgi:hypothetical protein